MRYPFHKNETSGPESYRDETSTVTKDETIPENSSSKTKNLNDNFSPNPLSTKVETSSSDTETEGSLPEENTGPQVNLRKETTMVTNQNKKKKEIPKTKEKGQEKSYVLGNQKIPTTTNLPVSDGLSRKNEKGQSCLGHTVKRVVRKRIPRAGKKVEIPRKYRGQRSRRLLQQRNTPDHLRYQRKERSSFGYTISTRTYVPGSRRT